MKYKRIRAHLLMSLTMKMSHYAPSSALNQQKTPTFAFLILVVLRCAQNPEVLAENDFRKPRP